MNDTNKISLRNENTFNFWKSKICGHARFETVFELATDRQRCTPDEVKNNSYWSQFMFPKPFAATTLKSYKSRLIKLIFCLIDNKHLNDYENYNLNDEFENIIRQRLRISCDEMCKRMLEVRSVTKETLQLTINFYTNLMGLPEYKIPKQVMLPKDKELKHIKCKEKNIVLKEIIDSVLQCIQKKLKFLNGDDVHDRGLLRGAIVFCIMLGTGMRINEARHLTVDDLNVLIKKGKIRNSIGLKRKKTRNNLLNAIKSKPLELAREIYVKHPTILQISKNTSTPFKDFKRLFEEAGVEMDRPRSNMIRHYLSSNLYNNGMPLQKVAKLMNHDSATSTRHYINKYDIGVNESDSDNENEDDNANVVATTSTSTNHSAAMNLNTNTPVLDSTSSGDSVYDYY
ncbi:very late factor 1 [Ectropis obliqua nucleopolyhedrovirus]|uniref:Very late expression factor 1 n=1 Tax=Ectropis obliqua nucleopolyhedrovirus TaxID=59376 RepID=A0EYW4_9ABAC|nr:very late factor 1 [Ectropis obliqua nucleopolyhedrovirus]ABI35744.1 very late factor 1 [Ectropis obliqua nucleopolyhedrovirus]AGS47916.1 very late expression factor 1 [Ectropis obliqua nucleopolyhedrovirus]QWV59670.1 very late factor 1 [Ectropis obliqua nucleopolyhedrovirus]UYO72859.1 very late factor 1 [Ectropis obliqua nucleopolyhedrovirus]